MVRVRVRIRVRVASLAQTTQVGGPTCMEMVSYLCVLFF